MPNTAEIKTEIKKKSADLEKVLGSNFDKYNKLREEIQELAAILATAIANNNGNQILPVKNETKNQA